MVLWIILFVAVAMIIYAIIVFNRLVRTRQMANEAWSGIDVQLKRRSDLVPNLVESVKGYAAHERSVLEEVTQLRGAARALPAGDVAAPRAGRRRLVGGARQAHRAGRELSRPEGERKFPRIAAAIQRAGERIADGAPLLQRRGAQFEYAGAVVPSNLIAGLSVLAHATYFEVSDAGDRAVPQVKLAAGGIRAMTASALSQHCIRGFCWPARYALARVPARPPPKSSISLIRPSRSPRTAN